MKKRYLPFQTNLDSEYPGLYMLFAVEGGAYFFAKNQDLYYVISDFGTMTDFLEEEDYDILISEYEFTNKDECRHFINKLFKDATNGQSNIKLPEELL